jgi:hypothetical protein
MREDNDPQQSKGAAPSSFASIIPEDLDLSNREPIPLPLRSAPEPAAVKPALVTAQDNQKIPFSRTVKATVGQQVEIPFGGSGWVYLGEAESQKGISYTSYRLETEGQSFVFSAEKAGVYSLKFYKQDFIRDHILNDMVEVAIGEAPAASGSGFTAVSRGVITATPRWPTAAEEASAVSNAAFPVAAAPLQTPPQALPSVEMQQPAPATDSSASPSLIADDYIQQAKAEYDANKIDDALSTLNQFREKFLIGSDEAWWLYAQIYEANGPNKDIRSARDYYQRLVNEYPLSSHWTDALHRISYLDRYYFNIQ